MIKCTTFYNTVSIWKKCRNIHKIYAKYTQRDVYNWELNNFSTESFTLSDNADNTGDKKTARRFD